MWQHGRPPASKVLYEILYQEAWLLFTGIHLAGPQLTPATFADGLFRYPASGGGLVTQLQRSFGQQGGWPFADYTAFDNVAEVWWDPDAAGTDETGGRGRGMYRFVDGGRRYGPGLWPADPPAVFDPSRASVALTALPPSDRYPTYPRV